MSIIKGSRSYSVSSSAFLKTRAYSFLLSKGPDFNPSLTAFFLSSMDEELLSNVMVYSLLISSFPSRSEIFNVLGFIRFDTASV